MVQTVRRPTSIPPGCGCGPIAPTNEQHVVAERPDGDRWRALCRTQPIEFSQGGVDIAASEARTHADQPRRRCLAFLRIGLLDVGLFRVASLVSIRMADIDLGGAKTS